MDIDALRIFREVARQGSFAAAARMLGLDPSAVSRAISALEAESGVRLFERTTRRSALTEAGTEWLTRVAPVVEDFDDAVQSLKDSSDRVSGRLRVTASTAFGEAKVVPMLGDLLAAHPDLDIDLRLTDTQVDLIGEQVDVAIRLSPEAPPDTVLTRLADTRYRVVAAPEVASSLGPDPADLAHVDCLRFAIPGFRDSWSFRKHTTKFDVAISGRIEMLGANALRRAALEGLGPALLADWLVGEALTSGRLIDCYPTYDCAPAGQFDTAVWGLTPSRRYRPRKSSVFLDAIRGYLRG